MKLSAWFVGLFALLLAFNVPHLGERAAMQWDTRTCLCTADPMPTAAELAEARRNLFDVAAETADPTAATAAFVSPAGLGRHGPLEAVRRYYSQPAYCVARMSFDLGLRCVGTFVGGVLFFQLTATALVAMGLALLGWRHDPPSVAAEAATPVRALAFLAFVAIATEPVFLSIARQVETETVGFAVLVPTLLLVRAAVAAPSRWRSVVFAAAVGGGLFGLVRCRYTLGPAAVLLVPIVVRHVRRVALPVIVAAVVFAACAVVDAWRYGPFLLPWVYDRALIQTARLYFHADPPYDAFWTATYVNGPLIGLPMLGLVLSVLNRRARACGPPLGGVCASYAIAAMLLVQTGRQQVSYQPRHLFTASAVLAVGFLLTVGRVRWRRATGVPLGVACGVVVVANLYSTLRPQQATMADPFPRTVAQNVREGRPMWAVLTGGYADPTDNRRVYDMARILGRAQATGPRTLLAIDPAAEAAGWYPQLASRLGIHATWGESGVAAALAAGDPVLVVGPSRGLPAIAERFRVEPVSVELDQSSLFRVRSPR